MDRVLLAKKLIKMAEDVYYAGKESMLAKDIYNLNVTGAYKNSVSKKMIASFRLVADDLCHTNPEVCKGNKGIPRSEMPQIKKENLPAFLKFLNKKGIKVNENQHIPAEKLKPTQKELDSVKVEEMIQNPKPSAKAILVSKDNHILDGHHRWAAIFMTSPKQTILCHKIDLPIKTLLEEIESFDKIDYKDLED